MNPPLNAADATATNQLSSRFLQRRSPLFDSTLTLDAFSHVQLGSAGARVMLASGESHALRVAAVESGLRLTIGGPPPATAVLVQADEVELEPRQHSGVVSWSAPNGTLSWGPDGPRFGTWQPPELFQSGRLLDPDGPAGWLITTRLQPDDEVYGGGESFQGPRLRGRLRHGINVEAALMSGISQSYLACPFYWSDAGWGVLVHTGAPVLADLGSGHSEIAAFAVSGDVLDVFLFTGSAQQVLQGYHGATGLPGRFPEWALGVWTSRCSYLSAGEVEQVIGDYQQAQCPVDVVHVDAWLEGDLLENLVCSWRPDRARFPQGWVAALESSGVRLSLWHNPFVLEGSEVAQELEAAGLLLRTADGVLARTNDMQQRHIVDLTNPAALRWWREQILRTVDQEGNVSFKNDFAEEIPPDAVCYDGRSGWEVRNEYSLLYQRATHDALVEATGDAEVALFCRSGTAGAQRYPCHWVGDTPSTWAGLVTAVRSCLSLSMSGFAIVGSDIGGFWAPTEFEAMLEAVRTNDASKMVAGVEPELFARWAQFGAMSGVMRFHGTGLREPHHFPSPYAEAAIAACRVRKKIQPELRDAAEVAARTGTPMMRPMALALSDDRDARRADLQYFLGDSLLAAPVLRSGGSVAVWNPGGRWEPLAGAPPLIRRGWHDLDLEVDAMPLWRREA